MELASRAKKEDVGLSYHTVYQTLNRLVTCGLASKIQSVGEGARYTHELNKCSHSHCVCQECGAVIDVMDGGQLRPWKRYLLVSIAVLAVLALWLFPDHSDSEHATEKRLAVPSSARS